MNLIAGLLASDPKGRLTAAECLRHAWINGDAALVSKSKAQAACPFLQDRPQRSMQNVFLSDGGSLSDSDEKDEWVDLASTESTIIKRGYMRKEGKLFKSWKKRWFILQNDGTVSYFHSRQQSTSAEQAIATFSCRNCLKLVKSSKIPHCFYLCTAQRNWKLICANDANRDDWIRAFESARRPKQQQQQQRRYRSRSVPVQQASSRLKQRSDRPVLLVSGYFGGIHSGYDRHALSSVVCCTSDFVGRIKPNLPKPIKRTATTTLADLTRNSVTRASLAIKNYKFGDVTKSVLRRMSLK